MFFAHVTYQSEEFGEAKLAVCSEKSDIEKLPHRADDGVERICFSCDGEGRVAPPVLDAIFNAAAKGVYPTKFLCNGVEFQLIRYTCIKDVERRYNPYRKDHIVRVERIASGKDIYVYSDRCRCGACYAQYGYDSIDNICGIVGLRDNPSKTARIDVQYCKHCGKYFVDQKSLAAYEREYGLLQIYKHYITGNEVWDLRNEQGLHPDSVLSRNGYSSTLPAARRQEILTCILRSGEAGKAEIKNLLIHFIDFNGRQNPHCIPAWEEDLKFVNDFQLDSEDVVRFC